jgi:hypothetical protein
VVRRGSPEIQLNKHRTRTETPETGDRGTGFGRGGRARQSVQSSLKNVYGTAVLRLPGLAAIVQSRAGLKMDETDDCGPWCFRSRRRTSVPVPVPVPVPVACVLVLCQCPCPRLGPRPASTRPQRPSARSRHPPLTRRTGPLTHGTRPLTHCYLEPG